MNLLSFLEIVGWVFGGVVVYMTAGFVVACLRKRNDIADIMWGIGFVLIAWGSFFFFWRGALASLPGIIVSTVVTIWGLRLAFHIYLRNRGRPEDYRYAQWRASWGRWFYLRSFLQVFVLQGALMTLISLPVIYLIAGGSTPVFLLAPGLIIWAVGFYFEAVGDLQLKRFISLPENKGRIMQSGLWAYTRHPNYFGEVTQWWGVWLMACAAPGGYLTIIGPLTITMLILKVSGIPMLEKKYEGNPEFEAYKQRTSAFIPLPPRLKSE